MSDERETQETRDKRPFEERVMARFDALDARLNGFETRLGRMEARLDGLEVRMGTLEDRVERRMQDTRPIWEQVNERLEKVESGVQEFRTETQTNFRKLDRQLSALSVDVLETRGALSDLEGRVDDIGKSRV